MEDAENKFHIAGGADVDGIAAEDAFKDVATDMDLRNQATAAAVAVGCVRGTAFTPIV